MRIAKTRPYPVKLCEVAELLLTGGTQDVFNENASAAYFSVRDHNKADKIRAALLECHWDFIAEDAGGVRENSQAFEAEFGPFQFNIKKPFSETDETVLLHRSSLINVLKENPPRIVRVGQYTKTFQLYSTVVSNWDEEVEFEPQRFDAEPNRLVRDLSGQNLVPRDLSMWLLRNPDLAPHEDQVFEYWKNHATPMYLRMLCSEIEPDRTMIFRGQPVLRVEMGGLSIEVSRQHFDELHSLVSWVYELKRESETRHSLAVAEIVRSSAHAKSLDSIVEKGFRGILESARHAYQIGLHKLGKDALQALSDLRKSVGDETSKAAEFTRQMTTSVVGALFAAVGVLAARLTLAKDSDAFNSVTVIVGVILFFYVLATAKNGWLFIGIQRTMREKWKERTQKFLSLDEYVSLVEEPAKKAEQAYSLTAWASILVAFSATAVILWFSYPDFISENAKSLIDGFKERWQVVTEIDLKSFLFR